MSVQFRTAVLMVCTVLLLGCLQLEEDREEDHGKHANQNTGDILLGEDTSETRSSETDTDTSAGVGSEEQERTYELDLPETFTNVYPSEDLVSWVNAAGTVYWLIASDNTSFLFDYQSSSNTCTLNTQGILTGDQFQLRGGLFASGTINPLQLIIGTSSESLAHTRGEYSQVPLPGACGTPQVSESISFTIPDNGISFVLHLSGAHVNNGTTIHSLTNPHGENVLQQRASLSHCRDTYCNVLIPKENTIAVFPGNWSYRTQRFINSSDTQIQLTLRTDSLPIEATLYVQAFLSDDAVSIDDLQESLESLQEIYGDNRIAVELGEIERLSEDEYGSLPADFSHSDTQKALALGKPGHINIFFAKDIRSDNLASEPLGRSPSIPGALGLDKFHGILISTQLHFLAGSLDTDYLATTAVHETGHFLGLFHTSEKTGDVFDIIPDTPECTLGANDIDGNEIIHPDECLELDGRNVMFYSPQQSDGGILKQTFLSPGQIQVIQYSPISQEVK